MRRPVTARAMAPQSPRIASDNNIASIHLVRGKPNRKLKDNIAQGAVRSGSSFSPAFTIATSPDAIWRDRAASLGLLPSYAFALGLAGTGALFVTLFALAMFIFQFPVGFASDQMDRSKLLLSLANSGLCGAIALAVTGTSHFPLFAACSSFGAASSAVSTAVGLSASRFAL